MVCEKAKRSLKLWFNEKGASKFIEAKINIVELP